MKKYILTLLLSIIMVSGAKAQFSVSYSAGYGDYKMNDMKDMMRSMLSSALSEYPQIPFAIVDNFPGYLNHTFDLSYKAGRHEAGIRFSYLTTGGKVAYSDYTGEYSGELTLNGYRIGLNYRFYIPVAETGKSGSVSLFAEMSPGITFSNLKSNEYMRIFTHYSKASEELDMKANGISLLPQVGAKWFITPLIGIHIGGGYDFQLGSRLKYQKQKTYIKSDWTGFRFSGGISFTFGR